MSPKQSSVEAELLNIVRQFLVELKRESAIPALSLHASWAKVLMIGSLEKFELLYRVEHAFSVRFSEETMVKMDSLNDLIGEIQNAGGVTLPSVHTQDVSQSLSKTDPSSAKTLVEVLLQYAENEPDRPHLYLQDEHGQEEILTYGQLYHSALMVAQELYGRGLKPKETVAIMLPTCREFFYVFMGVLLAGGVPVPIYPPFRPDQIEEYARREIAILSNAQIVFLVTFQKAGMLSKMLGSFLPTLKGVVTAEELIVPGGTLPPRIIRAQDSAMIQYTSGSTSDPKGVLLAHENLLANIRGYGQAIDIRPTDVVVTWLPLYHDMGLIGAWLGSFYYGVPAIVFSPLAFLARPERWLWAIHTHRATLSAGPNFAYELCIKKIDDALIKGLDLSSWRLAFNGAEAVQPNTLRRFTERYQHYGFKPETFLPVYGLAESSVGLTIPPLGRMPRIDKIARDILVTENRAVPVTSDDVPALEFPACGKALKGHEVRIVNEQGKPVGERTRGLLEFRGPSSMQGYYRNPQATAQVHHDGWWISGDYAYMVDGEVYITGRKKDVIIKAGRNLHPEGMEVAVGQVKGVRRGCVVAFGTNDPQRGTETLVIVAETMEKRAEERERMTREAMEKVAEIAGVPPDEVLWVVPGTIPKTSSGKLRRASCKELYVRGELQQKRKAVWLQLLRISLKSLSMRVKSAWMIIGRVFYTAYVLTIGVATLLPLWLVTFLLPRRLAAVGLKGWCRLFLALSLCPLRVRGKEKLKHMKGVVYVANHTSYIDTVVLLAVLPSDTLFFGKQEILRMPVVSTFVKKIGHLTVDRLDFMESLKAAREMQQRMGQQRSLLVYPEGTFIESPGLLQFRPGAFKVAVETQSSVVPVAVKGVRDIYGGIHALPWRGVIEVTICDPLPVHGQGWPEITRLRDASRAEIAQYCGESLLDMMAEIPK